MEEFILKAKPYQIFLSISALPLLVSFVPNFDPNVTLIKTIAMALPYVVWIFVLGKSLNSCIPSRHQLSETFLIINLFIFCILFVSIVMFSDGYVTFHGWAVVIPFYMLFSFIYMFYFAPH